MFVIDVVSKLSQQRNIYNRNSPLHHPSLVTSSEKKPRSAAKYFHSEAVTMRLSAVDGDLRAAAGEVSLGSNNLVVVRSKLHALGGPGVKVSLHVHGTRAALVGADRPVLLEGLGAVDGGLVGALGLRDLVRGAVSGQGALYGRLGRGVVGAEVLDDVVLDQRVAGPAVDGEVGVAIGLVGTGVGDSAFKMSVCMLEHRGRMNVPCGTRVPALSSNEVTAGLPAYAVAAASAVGVGSLGTTVGPPAVKAAVVGTLGRGSASTCSKSSQRAGSKVGDWGSESAGSRNGGSEDGCEGNHFSGCVIEVVCRIEV